MSVRDILRLIRRRWWVIVGCVVLGVAIAAAGSVLSKPQYLSTARLLVATPQIEQNALVPPGGITTSQRAVNYANLVTGTTIPQRVIDELHLTEPLPRLLEQTKVDVLPGTTIIEIRVTDPDPAQAQRISQAFATELAAYVPKIESQVGATNSPATITITDQANLPELPESGGLLSTLGLGVVGGLVVGAAILWLMAFMNSTVLGRQRLESLSGAPVLGTIDRDPAADAQPLLDSAAGHGARAESYRALRTALQFVEVPSTTPIFTVTGVRSGSGATTTAANIALSMARAGQRTLLVDADLHRPGIAALFGLAAHAGLAEVLAGTASIPAAVQHSATDGLDVLTSGSLPDDPTEQIQSKAMDSLLAKLRGQYDVIVVDSPPVLAVSDAGLLAAATDGAILVARYGATTDQELASAMERLSVVRARLIGSVLTGTAPADAVGERGAYLPALERGRPAGG